MAAERARIARELHDVLAHNLSVMVVQAAGGAPDRRADPDARRRGGGADRARPGREALAELRRLFGAVRRGEGEALDGPPGLGARRAAGRPRARRRPAGRRCGRGRAASSCRRASDLAAYRVVQEALTNALKHAGPATTEVTVELRAATTLMIEVIDDGARRRPPDADRALGGGHGLVGMRERVSLYGGEVEAGPAGAAAASRCVRALPARARQAVAAMSVRVLLVDDQALIRAGFRMILDAEEDIEVVGECADGEQAIDSVKRLQARRGADGHPHARDGRHRGDAADRRAADDATAGAGADADHLRPRRVRLRRAARRRQRLPAQGRAGRPARRGHPARGRAARPCSRRR